MNTRTPRLNPVSLEARRKPKSNQRKIKKITEIVTAELGPGIAILSLHDIEAEGFEAEGYLIEALSPQGLTNREAGEIPAKTAARLLAKVIPPDEWASSRNRTDRETELYAFVVAGLEKSALLKRAPRKSGGFNASGR